jgi:hypothetical protein
MTRGIRFIIDEKGTKTAVVIDLKRHGDLWEDFYDSMVARQRAAEPRESFESVKRRLRRAGKLRG